MSKSEPLRMCAVCRGMFPKSELIRIVKTQEGSFIADETGKAQGRGAYICAHGACIDKCIKKRLLDKSFKSSLPKEIYELIAAKRGED